MYCLDGYGNGSVYMINGIYVEDFIAMRTVKLSLSVRRPDPPVSVEWRLHQLSIYLVHVCPEGTSCMIFRL